MGTASRNLTLIILLVLKSCVYSRLDPPYILLVVHATPSPLKSWAGRAVLWRWKGGGWTLQSPFAREGLCYESIWEEPLAWGRSSALCRWNSYSGHHGSYWRCSSCLPVGRWIGISLLLLTGLAGFFCRVAFARTRGKDTMLATYSQRPEHFTTLCTVNLLAGITLSNSLCWVG